MPITHFDENLRNYFVFYALYFVQGLPFGLQTRFLPIFFRVNGMPLAQVDLFRLLMLPWLLKAFLAPLIDNFFTKKKWLSACLILLCSLCIMAAFVTPNHFFYLAVVMFLFNVITAVQDIALDSLMIETLPSSLLSKGNIAQVVGYKTGVLFSGGIFTLLTHIISWENIFFTLAGIYILGYFICSLFIPYDNPQMSDSGSSVDSVDSLQENAINRLELEESESVPIVRSSIVQNTLKCYFWRMFKTAGTVWMLFFVFIYKIGEQGVLNMYPMFMLDNGISARVAGFWTGFTGQAFSILGSFLGGLAHSSNLFSDLSYLLLIRNFAIFVIWMGVLVWSSFTTLSYFFCVLALQVVFLSGGAVTTITVTLIMQLSQKAPKHCRATHYTFLTTGDVLGRLLFASMMGGITELMGYPFIFSFFTVTSFFLQFFLRYAPPAVGNF